MHKLKYTFKSDILFKMLFVQNPHLLRMFVAALLGIPVESIEEFVIQNPELLPSALGEKFCRLDINMTVNGQLVDLEIQVENEGDYPDRTLLYWAKSFSASLAAGQKYSQLPRTFVISLVNFKLFDCEAYHSFFQVLESTRHSLLTDKLGLHFFELPKLPQKLAREDTLLLWLSLFKAETVEDLEKIQKLEVPAMTEAIHAYNSITASSGFREVQRLYEKARHDEAQALYNAEKKAWKKGVERGKQEGIEIGVEQGAQTTSLKFIHNLFQQGMPTAQIAAAAELPLSEVEALCADWARP